MKKSTWYRDLLVMLAALCVAGVAVVWVQRITGRIDGVAMLIFMLAVFVTSMYTDGYLWGVLASLASVLAVNFAFFTPYFAFNFTLPENLFSGLVMLAVSIMTSTLTTRVKKQEQLRMETEREKMRANLLRAVSHDLRTPLTSIYGACSTVTENYDSLGKEQALKLLREACEDAQWLNRMVENLLSVTRFDGEQVAVKKTPTVLDELIDTVLVRRSCPFAGGPWPGRWHLESSGALPLLQTPSGGCPPGPAPDWRTRGTRWRWKLRTVWRHHRWLDSRSRPFSRKRFHIFRRKITVFLLLSFQCFPGSSQL